MIRPSTKDLASLLDSKFEQYNQPAFIEDDPISIPHKFSLKQDIEIMGFFAAIFAWGQRKTIISKCDQLITLMEDAPYDFILNHTEADLRRFLKFKHRTFNVTDLLYFIYFFRNFYKKNNTLEDAFLRGLGRNDQTVENSLINFHDIFFNSDNVPQRTKKHIATPQRNSSCKRLNMFLRWMVRRDDQGVDFGIWNRISPHQLLMPIDIHVGRIARRLGILKRQQSDWKATMELTAKLREFDPDDPVKYDYALFGMSIYEGRQWLN